MSKLRDKLAALLFTVARAVFMLAERVEPPDPRPLCVDCGLAHVADDEDCPVCRDSYEQQQILGSVYDDGHRAGYRAAEYDLGERW